MKSKVHLKKLSCLHARSLTSTPRPTTSRCWGLTRANSYSIGCWRVRARIGQVSARTSGSLSPEKMLGSNALISLALLPRLKHFFFWLGNLRPTALQSQGCCPQACQRSPNENGKLSQNINLANAYLQRQSMCVGTVKRRRSISNTRLSSQKVSEKRLQQKDRNTVRHAQSHWSEGECQHMTSLSFQARWHEHLEAVHHSTCFIVPVSNSKKLQSA